MRYQVRVSLGSARSSQALPIRWSVDVNGDGWVDLVCAQNSSASVIVYTNNGNGGFALAANSKVGKRVTLWMFTTFLRAERVVLLMVTFNPVHEPSHETDNASELDPDSTRAAATGLATA